MSLMKMSIMSNMQKLRNASRVQLCLVAALALFVLFRLLAPIWMGQFGPDESLLVLKIKDIFNGAPVPLVNWMNTHGLYNGPYPIYFLMFIYTISQFNLGLALFQTGVLYVLSSFLVAAAVPPGKIRIWVLLFALTSPLHFYFSLMGLGDGIFLIPISALVLFLHSQKRAGVLYNFLIGALLGMAAGVHITASFLVAGISLSRLFIYRSIRTILGLCSGFVLGVLPYAIGLWVNRSAMSPSLVRPGDENTSPLLVDIPRALFRFLGQQAQVRINGTGVLLTAEDLLAQATLVFAVFLFLISVAFLCYRWKEIASSPTLTAVFLCAAFYIPFGWFTNTLLLTYGGHAIWWIAPIVIPAIILWLVPGKVGPLCLSLIVIFNLATLVIQYTPRIVNGTQASYAYGHGPSWWAYEEVAASLCAEVSNQKPKQGITTIEMAGDPWNERIRFILANLIKLKHPDCAQRIQLIWSDSTPGRVLRVEPDPDKIHLRVVWVTR